MRKATSFSNPFGAQITSALSKGGVLEVVLFTINNVVFDYNHETEIIEKANSRMSSFLLQQFFWTLLSLGLIVN